MSSNSPILSEFPIAPISLGASFISGYAFKSQDFCDEGLPVIKIKNIQSRLVTTADSQCVPPSLITEKLKKFLLNRGDVLIAMTGQGSVGRVGRLQCTKKLRPAMNQRVGKFVTDEVSLHKDYLYYVISSETYENHLFAMGSGSGQPNLSPAAILSVGIPQPAYQEQVAIAEILNALDDRISLLRETNTTLEAIAQALFKSWFVDFDPVRAKQEGCEPEGMDAVTAALFPDSFEESELGLVPKGWRVATVGKVSVHIFSGGTPDTRKPEYWIGAIPWFSSGETRNRIVISTEKRISQLAVKNSSTKNTLPGDILIASAGQGHTRGQTSYSAIKTYINQSVVAIRANQDLCEPLWLYYNLSRRYEDMRNLSDSHSSRGSLTTKLLAGMGVIVPCRKVGQAFADVVAALMASQVKNEQQAQTLATLRDTLLPRLISGQLRLSDAEVLIEEATA